MRYVVVMLLVVFIGAEATNAHAEQSEIERRLLKNRLNNLESQSIQRQGREPKLIDLLNRQDDRIAGQALNALKTRRPRDVTIPPLERKLLRSRRPGGRFVPR